MRLVFFYFYLCFSLNEKDIYYFPFMEYTFISLPINCRRGNKHFDVHLPRIGPVHFLSNEKKGAYYEGRNAWKRCLLPATVGILTFPL